MWQTDGQTNGRTDRPTRWLIGRVPATKTSVSSTAPGLFSFLAFQLSIVTNLPHLFAMNQFFSLSPLCPQYCPFVRPFMNEPGWMGRDKLADYFHDFFPVGRRNGYYLVDIAHYINHHQKYILLVQNSLTWRLPVASIGIDLTSKIVPESVSQEWVDEWNEWMSGIGG